MTNVPIPFVVAFLLLLLAATNRGVMKGTPTGRVFLQVIYLYAVSMIVIGLRWSLGMISILPIAAALAVITSALLYLAFCSLGRTGPVVSVRRDWPHVIPVVLVSLSAVLFLSGVDILLAVTKVLYAGLLAQLARRAPDSLQLVRLNWLKNTQQALWAAAGLLLFSLVLDVAIAVDFALYDGRHAEHLVGGVSFVVLLLLGWVSVLAGRERVIDSETHGVDGATALPDELTQARLTDTVRKSSSSVTTDWSDEESNALLTRLNQLLIEEKLYADTELNLQRLARKVGVPARSVSRAVNACTGQNVSQWVNQARIDAACELLIDQQVTVSEAMFASGFITKSNFNREFRRIKGASPSEWRNTHSE